MFPFYPSPFMAFLRLKPKLLSVLKEGYSLKLFSKDLGAGFLVGFLSLPMAIAFAVASGLKPQQGLYTAIIGGFIVSLFGGSRVQISGPTGTLTILVFTLVQQFGYEGFLVALLLAGIFLVVMGLGRLGSWVQFIPYPVTIGFSAALAVILSTGQIRDFLGLNITTLPVDFLGRWVLYLKSLPSMNFYALFTSIVGVVVIVWAPKITKKIPGSLIALLITTGFVHLFNFPVETIGSRFGSIPTSFAAPHFPNLNWDLVTQMISPAIAIALVIAIESLLTALVADGMTGRRHRPDAELVAQGFANVASSLFYGIPSTGSLSRTVSIIKNGGETPFSGIIHAVTLMLIFLCLGRWVSYIPMATLASILIVVAYNMSEWRHFVSLFKSPGQDIAVLLTTFFLTIFVGLTTGIEVSIILAAFLFIKNLVKNSHARSLKVFREEDDPRDALASILQGVPEEIEVFEIYGPFFFAATEKFKTALSSINRVPKVLILYFRHVSTIDASGVRALDDVLSKAKREGTKLFLTGAQSTLLNVLRRSGFLQRLEEKHIFKNLELALKAALLELPTPPKKDLSDEKIPA
jgi:sulfate permease, SulP family